MMAKAITSSVADVDPFPLDKFNQLSCTIFGFSCTERPLRLLDVGGNRFSTVKDDNTVELILKCGESCFLVGAMENFPPTTSIEYVRKMILDNRLLMHLNSFNQGQPAIRDRRDDPLDGRDALVVEGSTFRLPKIKRAIQPILDQERIAATKAANDEQVKEL